MRALQYLNRYFRKYRLLLLLGLLFTVSSRVFAVLAPSLVGDSITEIEQFMQSNTTDLSAIKKILFTNIALIVGAALISGGFTFAMRQTIINVSRHIEFDLKNTIYEHYQKLSLRFYKQNRTGDLMSRISEDVSRVRMYVGPAVMYSINTATLFIIVISYMVSVAPKLTLYTLLPLPILSFLIYRLSKAIHERSTLVQQMLSQLSTFAQESFSGINVIKSYAIEPNRMAEMQQISADSKTKNMSLVQVQAWFFPMMILLIGISNILVIFIGGTQYIDGQIELGVLAEFIIYINMLTWPVATVGWVTSIVQQAEASQKRINEFLGQEPDIQDNIDKKKKTLTEVDIAFKNVKFTYDDTGICALNNVSFSLEEGKTLAIMGPTGSGKTTLLQLLSKTYLPHSGEVFLGGKSLNEYAQKDIRNAMGVVPQQPFLFSDTIANNIRFGKEHASEEEIENAAKQAAVHQNIIDFKDGYSTMLGERGITLSGGQKQRVSIARALIKKPRVLLLDDCLSAVDTETEEAILGALKKHKNTTTLIVCHRVSSAKNADHILILKDGKVEQFGTHKNLVKEDGYYKELYTQQRLEEAAVVS